MNDNLVALIKNLAPIVGCMYEEKRWNPKVGRYIAESLDIASIVCVNVDDDIVDDGTMVYQFDNRISVRSSNIYKLASVYSPIVLNASYLREVSSGSVKDLKDLLFEYSVKSNINDSAIIDIFECNPGFKYLEYTNHIMLIILECFSLRFALFEYVIENIDFDKADINNGQIDKICRNIDYVKYMIEQTNNDNYVELLHYLAELKYIVLRIRYELNRLKVEVR